MTDHLDDPRGPARGGGRAGGAGEEEHVARARLFAALWPSSAAVARLGALARPASAGVRWVAPEAWHVTLDFLGDVDERLVPGLGAALVAVAARAVGPLEARLGPETVPFGRSVLAVPVGGLDDLARDLRGALGAVLATGAGVGAGAGAGPAAHGAADGDARAAPDRRRARPAAQPFRGHLTLARGRGGRPVPPALRGVAVEARWTVREVCLVRSDLARAGPRYTTLVRGTVPS